MPAALPAAAPDTSAPAPTPSPKAAASTARRPRSTRGSTVHRRAPVPPARQLLRALLAGAVLRGRNALSPLDLQELQTSSVATPALERRAALCAFGALVDNASDANVESGLDPDDVAALFLQARATFALVDPDGYRRATSSREAEALETAVDALILGEVRSCARRP